jgi:FtsP/CotA-like multicopper oxidase with cupredoxin domain
MDVIPKAVFPSDAHLPLLKVPKRDNDVIFSEDFAFSKGQTKKGPVFHPPNGSPGFKCDYSRMMGWTHSADSGARTQWLSHSADEDYPYGGTYDIHTDYDHFAPTGITRKYTLTVDEHPISADGFIRRDGGKAFNKQYPGPWIEACWGDTLEITIINNLDYNGTTIHWHGARMLNQFENDGVNGVTQCPIAPGDRHTYKFRVTQYGTSWYHSHYSLQYPDGLVGPMTFYGPAAADYDEAIEPFMMSDWSHNSAFEDYWQEKSKEHPHMQTNVLNGRGYFNCTKAGYAEDECETPPPIFTKVFKKGRKYLLRLINASTTTVFIFSIDKHILQVIESDLVPIEPYYADSILIGIGQRYEVIVEARPSNDLLPLEDQNYWIRTVGAYDCGTLEQPNPEIGIIRYMHDSTKIPTSVSYKFDTTCNDEPYESLVPVVPRTVTTGPHPANNIKPNEGDNYAIGIQDYTHPPRDGPHGPHGDMYYWDILEEPMWADFSNPTINFIQNKSHIWSPDSAVVYENYNKDDWVYVIISMNGSTYRKAVGKEVYILAAHPFHLHGHDVVLLSQQNRSFLESDLYDGTFKYDNPPRRDTVLLQAGGYIAVGFRLDNPGVWIFHCHIAWHASSGLGYEIIEREQDIVLDEGIKKERERLCKNWKKWHSDTNNWWDAHEFQEDSGV